MFKQPKLTIVLENLRSIYNVGSILRTANGFGVADIVFIGTTPYPSIVNDSRLPFQSAKQTRSIAKSALGAEKDIHGTYFKSSEDFLHMIQAAPEPPRILVLEQLAGSIDIGRAKPNSDHTYLVVGNEVSGVSDILLKSADTVVEIPMAGSKESFNVEVATAIALYQLLRV